MSNYGNGGRWRVSLASSAHCEWQTHFFYTLHLPTSFPIARPTAGPIRSCLTQFPASESYLLILRPGSRLETLKKPSALPTSDPLAKSSSMQALVSFLLPETNYPH